MERHLLQPELRFCSSNSWDQLCRWQSDHALHVGLEIMMQSRAIGNSTRFYMRETMQKGLRNYFHNLSILVILLFIASNYGAKFRSATGSCINNSRLLASEVTYCTMCNHKQPSHFFWNSSKKKNWTIRATLKPSACFRKFNFWEKLHIQRWQITKIFYISKASFIQDQRIPSTLILKICLWNRSTIKAILSLSNLVYFLRKILATVVSRGSMTR